MSFDDSEEQLRRQADDIDAICELHEYRTKPEWLFTDDDESGNEDSLIDVVNAGIDEHGAERAASCGCPITVLARHARTLRRACDA